MSAQAVTPLFLGTSLLIIATPGPDTALLTSIVLRERRRGPGLAAAAGMITAGACHALLALTGTALTLRTHPALFTALRLTGAAVMLAWGVQALHSAWRARGAARAAATAGPGPPTPALTARRAFLRGAVCTGSNPKVALFLLAYLPQFVPRGAAPGPAMLWLSGVYLTLVAGWLTALTLTVAAVSARTRRARTGRPRRLPHGLLDALLGAVFVGFAVRLVWG